MPPTTRTDVTVAQPVKRRGPDASVDKIVVMTTIAVTVMTRPARMQGVGPVEGKTEVPVIEPRGTLIEASYVTRTFDAPPGTPPTPAVEAV